MLDPKVNRTRGSALFNRRRLGLCFVLLGILLTIGYLARRTLLLHAARIYLERDTALIAQEKADEVILVIPKPSAWVAPMKNQMNEIWNPIKANGVNYYTFAEPQTWWTSYSERSNPRSPYYQAWVGGYIIQARDGSLPSSLETLAWQVTALDQRSWLSAMGDPTPIAESSAATDVGTIIIDGRKLTLWHGTIQSHSDLTAHPTGPLATLIGMPSEKDWPSGIASFHQVTLDGYFAGWVDPPRKVAVVIYAVASNYATSREEHHNSAEINEQLKAMMQSVKLAPAP